MDRFCFKDDENEDSFIEVIDLGVRIKRECDEFETRYKHESLTGIALTAMLANRAELVALYREVMEVAREQSYGHEHENAKLDAIDARFKKLEAGQ